MRKEILSIEITKKEGDVTLNIKADKIIENYFKKISGGALHESDLYGKTFYAKTEMESWEEKLLKAGFFDAVSSRLIMNDTSNNFVRYNCSLLRAKGIKNGVEFKLNGGQINSTDLELWAKKLIAFTKDLAEEISGTKTIAKLVLDI